MAYIQALEKLKVWIERPSGEGGEITGVVVGISFTSEYGTRGMTKTELEIIGDAKWLNGESISARRHAPEWKCDHCGRVNKMERTTCEGCGASRSFIYGP